MATSLVLPLSCSILGLQITPEKVSSLIQRCRSMEQASVQIRQANEHLRELNRLHTRGQISFGVLYEQIKRCRDQIKVVITTLRKRPGQVDVTDYINIESTTEYMGKAYLCAATGVNMKIPTSPPYDEDVTVKIYIKLKDIASHASSEVVCNMNTIRDLIKAGLRAEFILCNLEHYEVQIAALNMSSLSIPRQDRPIPQHSHGSAIIDATIESLESAGTSKDKSEVDILMLDLSMLECCLTKVDWSEGLEILLEETAHLKFNSE